jgi:hypothetical protein
MNQLLGTCWLVGTGSRHEVQIDDALDYFA